MASVTKLSLLKRPPTAEAKLTAVQLRSTLLECLELSIDNDWDALADKLDLSTTLVSHLSLIEKMTDRG